MPAVETRPTETTAESLRDSIRRYARYSLGKDWGSLTEDEIYRAVSLAVRDRVLDAQIATAARQRQSRSKRVYYLSMEFLTGRLLGNNLINLGLYDVCHGALSSLGVDLEEVAERERDPALGNGGLGRLAACFLDSLATLGYDAHGYGIHYDYGLFRQSITNGHQVEQPDNWTRVPSPWQIERADQSVVVPAYGHIEGIEHAGEYNPMWMDWQVVVGVPHDVPIVGYGGETVNLLRLFSAHSSDDFDVKVFNSGGYVQAVEEKIRWERLSKILYPEDSQESGKELRLLQEYFLVACAIRDVFRHLREGGHGVHQLPDYAAVHLNDTHPALAVPEIVRVLVDEERIPWEAAWELTRQTVAFTNHTLMPEALETWPEPLLGRVLPRHLQIVQEINRRFLDRLGELHPGDRGRQQRMSLFVEGHPKQVRMANLAIVGSHSVNGVAAIHSELVKTRLVPDFHALEPDKFNNKTNGITQRRWLLRSNPGLAALLNEAIGDDWVRDLEALRALEAFVDDDGFARRFEGVKRSNKEALAGFVQECSGVAIDPSSIFDVQAKRIHEYKRQLLNILHVMYQYCNIVDHGITPSHPKTYLFAGKAAPGYWAAKQVIKLIHSVAEVVNGDPRSRDLIRVAFLPDYRVSVAERLIPATELSEQISTAGTEASGTGNMKFALNGALTIGTLDGANIEIREEVGEENIFIFGLTTGEVEDLQRRGAYRPREYYDRSDAVATVMDALRDDRFCPREKGLFGWFVRELVDGVDPYFVLADFDAYVECQARATAAYAHRRSWTRMAMLNVARIGKFSSDRTIHQYAREIWGIGRQSGD